MQCVLLWLSLGRLRSLRFDAESSNNLDENGNPQLHTGSTKDERQTRFTVEAGSRLDHSAALQVGSTLPNSSSEVVSDTSGTSKNLPRIAVVARDIPLKSKRKQQLSWKQRLQKRLHWQQNRYSQQLAQPLTSSISGLASQDQGHELAPPSVHITSHATSSQLANVSRSWVSRTPRSSATDSPLQMGTMHSSQENLTSWQQHLDPPNPQPIAAAIEIGSEKHVSASLGESANDRIITVPKPRIQAQRHVSMPNPPERNPQGSLKAHWWSQMELGAYMSDVQTYPWLMVSCLIVFSLAGVAFCIVSRSALTNVDDREDGTVGLANQQAQESRAKVGGVTDPRRRNGGTDGSSDDIGGAYRSNDSEGSDSPSGSHTLDDVYRASPRRPRGNSRDAEQRGSVGDATLSDSPKFARAEWLEQYMKIQNALTPTNSGAGSRSTGLDSWALGDDGPAKGPSVIRITSVAEELEYVPTVRETPSDAPQTPEYKGRGRLTVIRESSEERRASKRSVSPCDGLLSAPSRA